MSSEAVQAVLERTVTDPTFRTQLFTHPEDALAEYELTSDESSAEYQKPVNGAAAVCFIFVSV